MQQKWLARRQQKTDWRHPEALNYDPLDVKHVFLLVCRLQRLRQMQQNFIVTPTCKN